MLDLNAGIAGKYASAFMVLGNKSCRQVLDRTIGYVMKNLYDRKTGAFYGSQDADEAFYTSERRAGPPPRVDTIIYSGPNARMIAALVAASGATGSKKYLEQAERAAGFMLENLYSVEQGVYPYYRVGERHVAGLLGDNVLFGNALIDLYNSPGKRKYIDAALHLSRLLAGKFFDRKQGSFGTSIETSAVSPSEPGALAEYASAVSNLGGAVFMLRISGYQSDAALRETALRATARTREDCERIGALAGKCGRALEWQLRQPLDVVIITDKRAEQFLAEVNRIYVPLKVVRTLSPKRYKAAITKLGYL